MLLDQPVTQVAPPTDEERLAELESRHRQLTNTLPARFERVTELLVELDDYLLEGSGSASGVHASQRSWSHWQTKLVVGDGTPYFSFPLKWAKALHRLGINKLELDGAYGYWTAPDEDISSYTTSIRGQMNEIEVEVDASNTKLYWHLNADREHLRELVAQSTQINTVKAQIGELGYQITKLKQLVKFRHLDPNLSEATLLKIAGNCAWSILPADVQRSTVSQPMTTENYTHPIYLNTSGNHSSWYYHNSPGRKLTNFCREVAAAHSPDGRFDTRQFNLMMNVGVLPTKAYRDVYLRYNKEYQGVRLPQSPKVSKLLEAFGAPDEIMRLFSRRGSKTISTTAFLSNEIMPLLCVTEWAEGWSSCQNWGSSYCNVWSNPSDPDLYVCWLGEPEKMLARCMVREAWNDSGEKRVVIMRYYGDFGLYPTLEKAVTDLLGKPVHADDIRENLHGRRTRIEPNGRFPYCDAGEYTGIRTGKETKRRSAVWEYTRTVEEDE